MARFICLALSAGLVVPAWAQNQLKQSVNDVLLRGDVVAHNIQVAIMTHLIEDQTFQVSKQSPEEPTILPRILVKKDSSFTFDWTPGQHARYLMEELRQGVHTLQASATPRGMDAVAFAGAREYWPQLRDISCQDAPGTKYYDLDGFPQYCRDK
jgi:hypothetical protein